MMTVPIHAAHRYGNPPFNCGGATVRVQSRHLATVGTIIGTIDEGNADHVGACIRRFIPTERAFILDLSGVDTFSAETLSFLDQVDDDCRLADVDWALVTGTAVSDALYDDESVYPTASSVSQALHQFADVISTRRRILLPLLDKSA